MTAAILAGAGAVVAVAIALTTLGLALRTAERNTGDARVHDAEKAGQIAIAVATIASLREAVAIEKARADALDDALDEAATDGDAAGARSRVLQRWAKARHDTDTTPDHDPGAVSAAPATAPTRSPDDLIDPSVGA